MAKPLVTYEDFKRSWMRITAKGRHASLDSIYEDVGRQSSKSTLQKYRNRLLAELNDKGVEILPATIPPDMVPLIEEFFTKSVAIAAQSYQADRNDLERQIERARSEAIELQETLNEANRIKREQADLLESLQNAKSHLQDELEQKQSDFVAVSEQRSSLSERIDRLKELHKSEMAALRQHHEAQQQDWELKLRASERHLNEQTDRANQAIIRADKNADYFLLQIRDEKDKSDRVEKNLQTTITRLSEQLTIAEKREGALSVKLGQYETRLLNLQDKFDESTELTGKTIHDLKMSLYDYQSENKFLKRENERLEEEKIRALDKLDRLSDTVKAEEQAGKDSGSDDN